MNDRSWIYRVSPKGLRRINNYNMVQGFNNYTLSNPKNICRCGI